MDLHGPVLVACRLDESDDEALRQADALARRIDARLVAVHVIPDLRHARMLFPHLHRADHEGIEDLAHTATDLLAEQVRRVTGRVTGDFDVAIESGSPHTGVLRRAEQTGAGVVVTGPGGMAVQVARHAPCPVLVARPSPPGDVLAASDFSDPALPALSTGGSEASHRGRRLVAVHCVEPLSMGFPSPVSSWPMVPLSVEQMAGVHAAAQDRLAESLQHLGIDGGPLVLDGAPAPAIAGAARDLGAELIVVGTHGRSGFLRLALGSVAEEIVRQAPCSVLVVRMAEHPLQ